MPRTAAPPTTRDEAAVRVLRQFRQIFNAVKTHFQQVEKKVGLGGAQVWALSVIRDQPRIGVGQLARAMSIHQSTASNLVKTLVQRELVAASKDGGDRRAVRLSLLPAGTRILRRSPAPFTGVLPQALSSLDGRALQRLESDLGLLIDRLRVSNRGADTLLADM